MGKKRKRSRLNRGLDRLGIHVELGPNRKRVAIALQRLQPVATDLEFLRVGSGDDGGYLLPNILEGVSAVFSPGVGHTAGFELALAERGIPSFLADGSLSSSPAVHEALTFEGVFIGPTTCEPSTLGISSWIRDRAPAGGDLLLQMDIEGGEWEAMPALDPPLRNRFRIIVLELHWLSKQVDRNSSIQRFEVFINSLLEHHTVVHAHPNNCRPMKSYRGIEFPEVLELTLVRNDWVNATGGFSRLPHPLDARNDPNSPEIRLPSCWVDASHFRLSSHFDTKT